MNRNTHRKGLSLILAAMLIVALMGSASQALANLSGSNFEGNDGNLVVTTTGNTDWTNAPSRVRGDDLPPGNNDNAFGQGTKEDDPNVSVVLGSIPPNKSDLTRFYVGSEFAGGINFLYLAWERSNVLGSANMDFELNQQTQPNLTTTGPKTLIRTAGDILITFDFTNGGSNPVLGLLKWVTSGSTNQCFSSNALPCWGNRLDLSAAGFAQGAVNTTTVTDPIANVSLPANTFGEAAINLSAAGVFPAGTCEALGSVFLKSRSSASFTAEVKDFVAPQPVNISNCGKIVVIKHTNARGINQSFGYTSNIAGTGLTCTSDTTPASFNLNDNGNSTSDSAANTESCTNVPLGSYSVTEGAEPAHFALESLTFQASGSGSSGSQDGANPFKANITLGASGVVTATYTNNHILANPGITTLLSASTVNIGDPVHDSATLTQATSDAGGTVTYTSYTNNACSAGAQSAGTKTVTNGVIPDSDSITYSNAGTFYWQAAYSGDFNNNPATSACTSEIVVVIPNSPGISTAQNLLPNDSATISGATANAGGTITFKLYSPSDTLCSGVASLSQTVNVSGNGTYNTTNTTFFASTEGTWRWQVTYSGDANNNGAVSACGVEQFTIANH